MNMNIALFKIYLNYEGKMKKIRTVIIEDHKLLRVGLKSLLEKCEDIVITGEAENGREGLEKARAQRPDVVIIDIGLDDTSGIEVGKKIS